MSELRFLNMTQIPNKLISIAIKKNDEFVKVRESSSHGLVPFESIETWSMEYLNIGDTIEIWTEHNFGSPVNLIGFPASQSSNLAINKI